MGILIAALQLLLFSAAGRADVTLEKLDPALPTPNLSNVSEPQYGPRDPTAEERNEMLARADLLGATASLDEAGKDIFLHRASYMPYQEFSKRYPNVDEMHYQRLKHLYENFEKNRK